jgi:adenine-specific DNA-methyltransferase
MARRQKTGANDKVNEYRHSEATRKNNPEAGLAVYERPEKARARYVYDPHLQPQLVWTGKAGLKSLEWDEGKTSFDVDVVSLHVHERISAKAILKAVQRPVLVQPSLFADPELTLDKRIDFYQYDIDWTNRLILGDSLLVANSLLVRESMAGKVQMIYIDPPYGIKYSSNFQPRIDKRDVKDKDEDLTREPEQIKAYRDTWELGIHSYLTYLRDRLLLCRELLHESGSIFVQINDENLHLVRCLLDEVFGRENFVAVVVFRKTGSQTSKWIPAINDYLLCYARSKDAVKYRLLFTPKDISMTKEFQQVELPDGTMRRLMSEEQMNPELLPEGSRVFKSTDLQSRTGTESTRPTFEFQGRRFSPRAGAGWRTTLEGLNRLALAGRILGEGFVVRYIHYLDDAPGSYMTNVWMDMMGEPDRHYAVQTNTKVIERCLLMTTDPGDLVFDPTCGSGTTAYCAEKWGRRWITCDTSRVALNIARQRLMTAIFDYYELADPERKDISKGFIYETVPHITLESIAHNTRIDAVAERYRPEIERLVKNLGDAVGKELKEWEIPIEFPRDWPEKAKKIHEQYLAVKRQKRQEIDEVIKQDAPQETLYDKPRIDRKTVRVSGPFTVEAIPVPVVEDPTTKQPEQVAEAASGYITNMMELLRKDCLTFPGGKKMVIQNIRPLNLGALHAEGEVDQNGETLRLAVSFGPQFGPVTAAQVAEATPVAKANGYHLLVFAGFAFDSEAQAFVQKVPVAGLQTHFANIAQDVLVGDLLKTTRGSQLFTVFGQPDVKVDKQKDNTYTVTLRGVDIYDPNTGELLQSRGENVAAWFLDTDYDGYSFHIRQAFFPNGGQDPWEKLSHTLKGVIDPEKLASLRGTTSLPFLVGKNRKIAVKVIDFRGNEVLRVLGL